MAEGAIKAQDLVKNFVGVRPIDVFHEFHWGTISEMLPEFVFNENDSENIDSKQMRRLKGTKRLWVPNLRYKAGRELDEAIRELAKEYKVTDKPLHEYGIRMVVLENCMSYRIKPFHDIKNDRYLLYCADGIPKAFNKKKLARDLFEIEY